VAEGVHDWETTVSRTSPTASTPAPPADERPAEFSSPLRSAGRRVRPPERCAVRRKIASPVQPARLKLPLLDPQVAARSGSSPRTAAKRSRSPRGRSPTRSRRTAQERCRRTPRLATGLVSRHSRFVAPRPPCVWFGGGAAPIPSDGPDRHRAATPPRRSELISPPLGSLSIERRCGASRVTAIGNR
jgi:hypothetical protein